MLVPKLKTLRKKKSADDEGAEDDESSDEACERELGEGWEVTDES